MANWFGILRQVQQIILDLVYPRLCVSCRQPGAWWCQSCIATIEYFPAPRCIKCDLPIPKISRTMRCQTCERQPIAYLDGIRTVAPHKDPLRRAIHALKYDGRQEIEQRLGLLLVECWRARGRVQIDGLLPVPLHPNRQKERGFNQSERLANVMSQHLVVPLCDHILIRTRDTASQVGLSGQERLQNMGNAFVASPQAAGKRWLLVDDVCTTGSTLMACAYALRKQNAQAVWAITLTRPFYDYESQRWQDEPPSQAKISQQTSIWEWNND